LIAVRPAFAPHEWVATARIKAIDFARGVAVALMIVSHGVKGLLPFEDIPAWGLVPVHLVTKFASTLFFIVFGISLAASYVPYTESADWPRKKRKLLIRGMLILFWYKVLTIVEMFQQYKPGEIIDTLLYRSFPVYSEILGFYAIALLWLPFVIPLWRRIPAWLRWCSPMLCALTAWFLHRSFQFFGCESLHAILVEHENHYTWGQLARLPMVLFGMLIGGYFAEAWSRRVVVAFILLAASILLFIVFYLTVGSGQVVAELFALARNEGKHPPEFAFVVFSAAGALGVVSASLYFGNQLAAWFKPITLIGSNALQAFIFHLSVLFVGYRFLLGYWHQISYQQALLLTLVLLCLTALWIAVLRWIHGK